MLAFANMAILECRSKIIVVVERYVEINSTLKRLIRGSFHQNTLLVAAREDMRLLKFVEPKFRGQSLQAATKKIQLIDQALGLVQSVKTTP
jgi:hypothetical protein